MLKEKALQSIEALLEHSQDPERINCLIKSIKQKVDFGDTPLDHWKTFYLIFLMYDSWDDVKTNPNNKDIIALSVECEEKMKSLFPTLNEAPTPAKTKTSKQTPKSPRPKLNK